MEARQTISIRRSGARQLSDGGISGPLSPSIPVLSTPLENTFPKLPHSQQVPFEREVMSMPLVQAAHLSSNSGLVGHIFSSSSGFSSDLHYSSASPPEKHPEKTPFILQPSTKTAALPLTESSHSELLQSTTSCHYIKEHNSSWCSESLPGFLEFPANVAVQNAKTESSSCSSVAASEDPCKQSDWQEWADQLITDDDTLASNWSELLIDNNIADTEPKVAVLT